MRLAFPILLALALSGCANPVAQFYQGMVDVRSKPAYDASDTTVRIFTTNDFERDRLELARRGYIPIGQSNFNADAVAVNEGRVHEHAAKIGAQIVLVSSRYSHTVSGASPLIVPTSATSFSSGTATAYGPAGMAHAVGSSTTRTYGQQVVMAPYSISRSDFSMLFFAKNKNRVGTVIVAIDDATRRRLQTNSGVRVESVVNDSPAFFADVLPGDIILEVAGEPVSENTYYEALKRYEGRRVTFQIDRDGKRLDKEIEIRTLN